MVGVGSSLGSPIGVDAFADHVFGAFLVNDWSARDIQAWESRPLGPFLAKSFATSISPWIVPLEALAHARVRPPPQDPEPLPYLSGRDHWGLDLALEIRLNGQVIVPAAVRHHVLDARPDAGPPDRERRLAPAPGTSTPPARSAARTASSAAACWS